MGIVLKIALRYLKAKKSHNAVNIISVISVCGVVLATAALLCVLSVFNGFAGLMSDKLAKLDPQINVTANIGKTINNVDSLLTVIRKIDGIATVMPIISDQALAVYDKRQMPVTIKGVPDDYNRLSEIEDVIKYGSYAIKDSINKYAILSIGVASNLQSNKGFFDYLKLYAPKRKGKVNLSNPMGAFRTDSLYISAIYQTDQNTHDQDIIYVPLEITRHLFDYPVEATSIEIKLEDNIDEITKIAQIQSAIGNDYSVKNRLMQQETAFKMVNVEKWVTFLLLSFILVIAAFNVISSLSLLIIEKDESIRTFRNLGATNRQISNIFITEGLLISLVGAFIGISIGIVLCILQQEFGLIKLAGDATAVIIDSYPVKLLWSDILIVFVMVAIVGLLTSFVTALLMRSRLKE